jgi:hypothetical protein
MNDLTKKPPSSNGETLKQILASVDNLRGKLGEMNQRLGNLEQKVDERLQETRPIWEKVASDISQLQQGQLLLQGEVSHLRNESREVRTLLRDIFRRLSIFNDTLVTMQADYRDIYDRVRGLELGGTSQPST